MNGIKKAALFLSGLDYTEADQLLSRLDGESARIIRREIMSLQHHNVSAEMSHQLDEEFLHSAGWTPARSVREHQFATPKPTTYIAPKRPTVKYTAEAFVPPVRSFDFMRDWSVSDVVSSIIDEHPQTIAVVLAHLPQKKMKSILSALPTELQREIKRRLDGYAMPGYEAPDEQIIEEIETALKMRYRSQRRSVRRSAMLESFDDIEILSDSELATLFRSIDLTKAMLALLGTDPALIDRITRHFSPTEKHEMRKRFERLNSVDEEDIIQARRDILEQYNATI